jgi:Raf kinase inhibitor-like YbhB/YbcL family protein
VGFRDGSRLSIRDQTVAPGHPRKAYYNNDADGHAVNYAPQPVAAVQACGARVGTNARVDENNGEIPMAITVQSTAFRAGETIPARFTGDGQDISPALTWSGVPADTKELVLICDDPDAPRPEPWVHWVMYKIPGTVSGLMERTATTEALREPAGAMQGKNSWGRIGYGGPAPPRGHGVHHYHFKLYALDAPLDVRAGLEKDDLLRAMKGHIVAEGEIVGTYRR